MKPPRPEPRTRRPIDRPAVEGLELRLALSGDPLLVLDPPPLIGPTDPFTGPLAGDPGWGLPPLSLPSPDLTTLLMLEPPDLPDFDATPFDPIDPAPGDPIPFPIPDAPIDWGNPGPPPPSDPSAPAPLPLPPPTSMPTPTPTPTTPASTRIVSVDPADGARVRARSIAAITVTFDVPLRTEGLSPRNFALHRIDDAGNAHAVFDRGDPPAVRLSGDGSKLLLIPRGPLDAGRYRLTLYADARFLAADGEILDGGTADAVLSEFRVVAAPPAPTPAQPPPVRPGKPVGPTLADAIPLGTVGAEPVRVSGTLDLDADPAAVLLYRIRLAPGHSWRLGLEVSAGRLGSPLLSRLSLFDADGRLLSTGTLGMADAPADPFLFAGLAPGTYYVGISGAGNDPSAGGYDPATGAVPVNLPPQRGGAFALDLVADPADRPTRLLGVSIDRADPADPAPTGVTLRFDGPVILAPSPSASQGTPVEVVDESGRIWRASLASTDEAGTTLSLLFAERLPRGRYEIRLPSSGGIVDLIGRPPAAEGLAPGVLGRFEIATEPTSRRPNDLGALLPDRAAEGADRPLYLSPGMATAVRFVVTFEAHYALSLSDPGGGLTLELVGPDGPVALPTDPRALNGTQVVLRPGVYFLRVANPTGRDVDASLAIRALDAPRESVPLNGVGQGPALGMRLAAPAAGLPTPDPAPLPPDSLIVVGEATVSPMFGGGPGSLPGGGLLTSAIDAAPMGAGMPAGPILTPETAPLGYPSAEPLRVVALGDDASGAIAATAWADDGAEFARMVPVGLGQGTEGPGADPRRIGPDLDAADGDGAEQGGAVARNGAPAAGALPPLATDALDAALAQLDPAPPPPPWLGPLVASGFDPEALAPAPPEPPAEAPGDGVTEIPLLRAVGVGLAVGWTARYWSRRQIRAGRDQPGAAEGAPAGRGAGGGGPSPRRFPWPSPPRIPGPSASR